MIQLPNKSKAYLLPLFDYYLIKIVRFTDIYNTYCFTNKDNKYTLVYKSNDFLYFNEYYKDKGIVRQKEDLIYITFEIPDSFIKDYYKFIKGKYSKFHDNSKKIILHFADNVKLPEKNLFLKTISAILYKREDYRKVMEKNLNMRFSEDTELSSIINQNLENININ
jgi:hypothetical protein